MKAVHDKNHEVLTEGTPFCSRGEPLRTKSIAQSRQDAKKSHFAPLRLCEKKQKSVSLQLLLLGSSINGPI